MFAASAISIVITADADAEPPSFVAVTLTVYVPPLSVGKVAVAPNVPTDQLYVTPSPTDEAVILIAASPILAVDELNWIDTPCGAA